MNAWLGNIFSFTHPQACCVFLFLFSSFLFLILLLLFIPDNLLSESLFPPFSFVHLHFSTVSDLIDFGPVKRHDIVVMST